jgi:hypothetical protein
VGEWIPEPLPECTEWISGRPGGALADPADRVTLDESVNMAFLVVLESMTRREPSRPAPMHVGAVLVSCAGNLRSMSVRCCYVASCCPVDADR